MSAPDAPAPRPPWEPRSAAGGAGQPPTAAGARGLPTAVRAALGLGAAAVLTGVAWWILAAATLGRAAGEGRCDTALPDGAATDLLLPVHALLALLLAVAVALPAAARPPGAGRTARLVVLGVVLLVSLLMPLAPGGALVLGAGALGLVLVPLGAATSANLLLIGRRRADVAHPRWPRRALATEALLWPLLIGGPALSAIVAHLSFADLFCF